MIVGVHEYILCYSKTESFKFVGTLRSKDDFSNPDNDPRGIWRNTNLRSTTKDASQAFEITDPLTGRTHKDTWAFSPSEMQRMIVESRLIFPASNDGQVRQKEFFSEFDTPYIPVKSSLGLFDAQKNTEVLTRLMGEKLFQNPKHIDLMRLLISIAVEKDDLILDFFAGSGSTAHGMLMQNAVDNGKRRHILVQLPEYLDLKNKDQASAAAFCDKLGKPRTIAELTKERLRRGGKKIKDENPLFAGDLGFRVFKLASSNIRAWEPDREKLAETLEASIEHLKTDRTEQDILFELLLKLGLDLCVPIETKTIAKHVVHSIGAGTILVCLSTSIQHKDVEPLALGIVSWHQELAPTPEDKKDRKTSLIFRDSAFADDVAKTNLSAILHQHGLENVRSL